MDDDNNDIEQLIDNEDDWRDDLRLSESSEEEDDAKEEQKEEKQPPAREEPRPRVLPPAQCSGCGLIGHSQEDALKCPKVNPRRRTQMDTKKAKTYADRARKGTQPTALPLPVICSSAKRAARAGGIAAAQASGGKFSAEGATRAAKRRAMEQLFEGTTSSGASERVGNATERAVTSGLDGLTGRMGRDVACALSRAAEVESRYKRMGTALRESVAQFAQTAQMMSEAAKRMGDVLEATLADMAVIQGQQNRAEAARIDGTCLRLAVMRRDIVRPPGVSPEATCVAAKGRERSVGTDMRISADISGYGRITDMVFWIVTDTDG
uniref:Proteoglycan 4-like n=1 Tax=Globodera pallida TaxID=36090 RepID=A0A183BQC8_GLOPA